MSTDTQNNTPAKTGATKHDSIVEYKLREPEGHFIGMSVNVSFLSTEVEDFIQEIKTGWGEVKHKVADGVLYVWYWLSETQLSKKFVKQQALSFDRFLRKLGLRPMLCGSTD